MSKRLPTPFSSLSDEDSEQPELPDLSVDTQPEPALDKKETSRLVREILAELSEEQHLIIGMRYYEDLSVMTTHYNGFESSWLEIVSPLAWVWLEPDTPVSSLWDEAPTLETFFEPH